MNRVSLNVAVVVVCAMLLLPAHAAAANAPAAPEQSGSDDRVGREQSSSGKPPNPAEVAERLLHQRTVLGMSFHGHVFIDGLPLTPEGLQVGQAIDVRRARVQFDRRLVRNWELRGSAELLSGAVELKDLYVRRRFARLGTFTIGNQSEPFGLDELTSALSLPLLEPSLPTAMVPGRNFGIVLGNRRGNFLYQIGVFGAGTEQEGRRDLGSAATGRLTHRILADDGAVRHFGVAISARGLDSEQLRSIPEVDVDHEHLVDTGEIADASRTRRIALEYLQTFGALTAQAEAMRTRVSRDPGPALAFGGAHVELGWTLWGAGPVYDDADAVFARAPVASPARWRDAWGRGNLVVSARLSRIDLTDQDITGGTETNLTLGATWDFSPRSRLAANIVRVVDLTGPRADADDSTAIAVRFQYAW